MNYIKYSNDFFHGDSSRWGTNGLFMDGKVEQRIALFGDELTADSLTFTVVNGALDDPEPGWSYVYDGMGERLMTVDDKYYLVPSKYSDWRSFTPGDILDLYNEPNGVVIGRFYVLSVEQDSKATVKFTCTDCIGMLMQMADHVGGLYTGNKTFGQLITEIFTGTSIVYSVDATVASWKVYGRLPYANRRENLGRLLVASGATLREVQGVVTIDYLAGGNSSTIAQTSIYLGTGKVNYSSPATEVQVVEHGFHQTANDETKTLFDNTGETSVTSQLVIFDEPCYNLTASAGLTINSSGVNYAILTGVGTLTGKEYTHTRRVISRTTGVTAAAKVVAIEDNQLITIHNSANVAQRMVNYYGLDKSVTCEQYDASGALLPGSPVAITDPFGVDRTGWIRSKRFDIGNKTKAQMDVLAGWTPGPFGDSYSAYKTFKASDIVGGVLSLPAEMQGSEALVLLFGGSGGGQGGYDGEDGEAPSGLANYEAMTPGQGGYGGYGGQPGDPCKVYTVQVQSLPASYSNAAIGAGGAGGAHDGGLGSAGGNTTLGSWSSANGSPLIAPHVNIIDGTVYGEPNDPGENGADGGIGSGRGDVDKDTSTNGVSHNCESGTVYAGGAYANGSLYRYYSGSTRRIRQTGGAGGGGAAHGAAGSDGYAAYDRTSETTQEGSWGGDGATATAPAKAPATRGGRGGHGGGGGGGAAQCRYSTEGSSIFTYGFNHGGVGGQGSVGGEGGDGLILIYYTPQS